MQNLGRDGERQLHNLGLHTRKILVTLGCKVLDCCGDGGPRSQKPLLHLLAQLLFHLRRGIGSFLANSGSKVSLGHLNFRAPFAGASILLFAFSRMLFRLRPIADIAILQRSYR
jgi:hypothetical protein